jgi:hypothetical protein
MSQNIALSILLQYGKLTNTIVNNNERIRALVESRQYKVHLEDGRSLRFKKQGMGEFSLVPRRDLIQRTHRMPS